MSEGFGVVLGFIFGLPLFVLVMILRRRGRCHTPFWDGVVIGGAIQASIVAIGIVSSPAQGYSSEEALEGVE